MLRTRENIHSALKGERSQPGNVHQALFLLPLFAKDRYQDFYMRFSVMAFKLSFIQLVQALNLMWEEEKR